ncbi:MAG: T9SS type A sorting domain-containing protein [Ferruginibacter sp.]
MKKLYTVFACTFMLSFYCKAQFVDLPADDFKTFLMGKYPGCFNGLQQLDTTCTAITTEDSLTFQSSSGPSYVPIQYFDALEYLDLSYCSIDQSSQLPAQFPASLLTLKCDHMGHPFDNVSPILSSMLPSGLQHLDYSYCTIDFAGSLWPAGLKYLDLSHTQTSNLGTLPPALDTLICNNAEVIPIGAPTPTFAFPTLGFLPALPATLKYLDCSNDGIASLPALPAGLTWLNCSNNYTRTGPGDDRVPVLASLPALPASLEYLSCNNNRLEQLPALPASLKYLDCATNKFYLIYYLTSTNFVEFDYPGIDIMPALPSQLEFLYCANNQVGNALTLPATLKLLSCATNAISSLSTFPASLLDIDISNNPITSLGSLPPVMAYLNFAGTQVSCLPHLPASMAGQSPYNAAQYNLVVNNIVNCLPNSVAGIRFQWPFPLCNVVNNVHACETNPVISGNVFYDNNSNGIQDPGELPKANVRVALGAGMYAFSDINGHYEITGAIGSNTLTIDPPLYYNAVPSTFNYNFSTYDTLVSESIALQPNIFVDSVKITITPWTNARPGFPFAYNIHYENVGTTIVNPNIVVNYDSSRLIYGSSSNASVVHNAPELSLGLSNLQPGQSGQFSSDFSVKVSALPGDVIFATSTVTAGTATASDSAYSLITASFDPNDKQATPSLTAGQVLAGDYIEYLVRFQNTGTDTAFTVVITDTLSSQLQWNTLQMIDASHAANITQADDKVAFEFKNINLPDKNTNEPKSHGYVRFRIKPQPGLPDNTDILNRASIYFDYNAPVLTGDATTTVNFIVLPINLGSFNVRKQNATVQLFWSTEQENNSRSFIIERSSTGNKWDVVTSVPAAGNSSQKINYTTTDFKPAKGVNYYRLKQVDLDGKFNYSEIRSVYFGNDVNIVLVPNPAVDKVTVYLPGNTSPVSINIHNMNGQLVKQLSSNEEAVQIDVSGLSKGIYSLRINGKAVNEVRKLIVK